MKRFLLPLLAFILVLGNCTKETPAFPWIEGDYTTALSKVRADNGKLVMLEFSTDWCVWCKRLAADTWTNQTVIDFAGQHLIPLEIDAEKGDGIELAKKYHIGGYPTMVFVNADGEEFDRIPGYLPADDMVKELTRITSGVDTYPALRARVEANPDDAKLLVQFAQKTEDMQGLTGSLPLWEKLFDLAGSNADEKSLAAYKVAQNKADTTQDPAALHDYLQAYSDTKYIPDVYNSLSRIYKSKQDTAGEARTLTEYVGVMEQKGDVTSQLYNGYAWRMTELGMNLDDALVKIKKGLALLPADADSTSRAQMMDTEAEVLWKLGRPGEAVIIIDQCIALQPNDEYYTKQKTKFQAGPKAKPAG